MTYKSYTDIRLLSDPEVPLWDRMGRVWHMTHVASARLNLRFAVSFPGWMSSGFTLGETLRVFCSNSDDSKALLSSLESASGYANLVKTAKISTLNAAPDQYEAYLMHRLPSGISKSGLISREVKIELQDKAKARRIVQQQHLPFVRMRSSSGNLFRLVVERISANPHQAGRPNGYGLSRITQVVALPVLLP
jgi:CRISPR-associated endoribonuclease Cas6/Csy4 subtype I-F